MNIEFIKEEIKRVNKVLREDNNPFTQKQCSKYLKRLERELRHEQKTIYNKKSR